MNSQEGFDLVGKVVCVCIALGKGIFLTLGQDAGYYRYGNYSGLLIAAAFILNSAFNLPALVYIALWITGNPDLKRIFANTLLVFPVGVFLVALLFIVFNGALDGIVLLILVAAAAGGLYYVYTQVNQFVLT